MFCNYCHKIGAAMLCTYLFNLTKIGVIISHNVLSGKGLFRAVKITYHNRRPDNAIIQSTQVHALCWIIARTEHKTSKRCFTFLKTFQFLDGSFNPSRTEASPRSSKIMARQTRSVYLWSVLC